VVVSNAQMGLLKKKKVCDLAAFAFGNDKLEPSSYLSFGTKS